MIHSLTKSRKSVILVGTVVSALIIATVLPLALTGSDDKKISANGSIISDSLTSSESNNSNDQSDNLSALFIEDLDSASKINCVCFTAEDIDRTVSTLQLSNTQNIVYDISRSCSGSDRTGIFYSDISRGYPLALGVGVNLMFLNDQICQVADMMITVTPEEGLACKNLIDLKCAQHAVALNQIANSQN